MRDARIDSGLIRNRRLIGYAAVHRQREVTCVVAIDPGAITIAGDVLVGTDTGGMVRAIDTANGKELWSFPIDDNTVRESIEAIVDRLNTYVDTLNGRLFSFQDYAIIGEK